MPADAFIGAHWSRSCCFQLIAHILYDDRVGSTLHLHDCHLARDRFSRRKQARLIANRLLSN